MLKRNEHHAFTGMQKDLAASKHPSSFLKDAHNIRLTQREGETLLAITNEKGTLETNIQISGDVYLGHCLLGKYLVVFSTDASQQVNHDYIDKINLSNDSLTNLFIGNLNFQGNKPIEAIGSYESENVQKVYWTDKWNQPRMINIQAGSIDASEDTATYTGYDFVRTLQLNEEVHVTKLLGASGMFPAGVIQYSFTYYDKFGQESNIFYTTPLLYISHADRGGSPEDKISNAFQITVSHVDSNFNYLRIYSILRTSINGTPIVKRVQDIDISSLTSVYFTDTGTEGDTIDPTELLYKGGEQIIAGTIEQKDGTLFLGDIEITRNNLKQLESSIQSALTIDTSTRTIVVTNSSSDLYTYGSQLSAYDETTQDTVPCGYFKKGNTYRLGVQFQHVSGKWSDPIWKGADILQDSDFPELATGTTNKFKLPIFTGTLSSTIISSLIEKGYVKVRGVVVFPEAQDRTVMCQGIACPTMKTTSNNYYQSSWFFRPNVSTSFIDGATASPRYSGELYYTQSDYTPTYLRAVEIQGTYSSDNKFSAIETLATLHTPDIEFDEDTWNIDFSKSEYKPVGNVVFSGTYSDIDIQTESPAISGGGKGFVHQTVSGSGSHGFISGLFYEDYLVDDDGDTNPFEACPIQKSPMKWVIFPWHRTGSLNNDSNRTSAQGVRSAVLKKKILSNLRIANVPTYSDAGTLTNNSIKPQVFNSDQTTILKLENSTIYQGNIDTLLYPDGTTQNYFAFGSGSSLSDPDSISDINVTTPFTSTSWWRTGAATPSDTDTYGIFKWGGTNSWIRKDSSIDIDTLDLVSPREMVRMKYKSTPHIVFGHSSSVIGSDLGLPVIELHQSVTNRFGGTTPDALKANQWLPCGEPVKLENTNGTGGTQGNVTFKYSYGDTYFQRWDCLKTYAFTKEDINQVVEIGSFMLETYVNIDGRYDRNRGQMNNLNMSPVNFNLLNPVYSQKDNFFTYRIMDEKFYDNVQFPNQITWSKEKQFNGDTDLWTNITLASIYNMDGSKGSVRSLIAWKDQLFCFQDKGISNILFNSRVQIPTSDGVPIEISNSYKVDGYRYISDGIGCINKWTIKDTPTGIYFIDSVSNDLFHISDGITDIALSHNMSSWFKGKSFQRTVYDDVHHDVYVLTDNTALCYSEILGQFTSFMDYQGTYLVESYNNNVFALHDKEQSLIKLYKMFYGAYNYFFTEYKPWSLSFISNGIDEGLVDIDKVFSNVDYRMDFYDEEGLHDANKTFDWVRVDNEYQDTQEVSLNQLSNTIGYSTANHYPGGNPQKKFRIWRIQIPRAKKATTVDTETVYVATNDRIRNPWCTISFGKKNDSQTADDNMMKAILHDLNVQYYI